MKVRRVTSRDRSDWLRMRSALWPRSGSDHARDVDAHFQSPTDGSAVFVAESPKGELVGFLEARLRDHADGCSTSPVAYVEGWYVDPASRRSGVGSALLEATESWARGLGLSELASDSDLENEIGQRAHRACGFREVGRVVQFRKPLQRRL